MIDMFSSSLPTNVHSDTSQRTEASRSTEQELTCEFSLYHSEVDNKY